MEDHDQRFKVLLQEFFPEFFAVFFPEWAARFDFSSVVWLDKEAFPDPPRGARRYLDLVAQLPTHQGLSTRSGGEEGWVALVHVEIEHAESVAPFRPRMFEYYTHLRRRHGLPVLPIALYLRVGLDGIGRDCYEEAFWDLPVLRFEYLYVGLPALDAAQYVEGGHVLGAALAALMHVAPDRKAWLAAQALRLIGTSAENPWRKYLLGEVVQTYLPLEDPEVEDLDQFLVTKSFGEANTMQMTLRERAEAVGRAKGLEEGQGQGQRALIRLLVEERFGPVTPQVGERLAAWPAEQLADLARSLLRSNSLDELGLGDKPAEPATLTEREN